MNPAPAPIPVVLFAYRRRDLLERTLASLRANAVPRIIAYADGAKDAGGAEAVATVRRILRAVDWCDVTLIERESNLGLGRNILAGVTEVARRHEAFVVWEDDLVAVPGAYRWLCAALRQYADDPAVMSITGWTHPRVTPPSVEDQPYFDGRAECWVWASWSRAWRGMPDATAAAKQVLAAERGVAADAYGVDLPLMAEAELRQNIWAVRWLYHHFEHGGLCLRPPWSMVEHIGFDDAATNAAGATAWANPPLRPVPPIPIAWPTPREHPECRRLWREANPMSWRVWLRRLKAKLVHR